MGPNYQALLESIIRNEVGIKMGAVGLITDPDQVDKINANGRVDIVWLGREFLRDPYWPLHATWELGEEVNWPDQYLKAVPARIDELSIYLINHAG
jgi:2,4-dienoyl-CoA reductase-like NADH-dependent reductase (Old Yellow Enzyme family)